MTKQTQAEVIRTTFKNLLADGNTHTSQEVKQAIEQELGKEIAPGTLSITLRKLMEKEPAYYAVKKGTYHFDPERKVEEVLAAETTETKEAKQAPVSGSILDEMKVHFEASIEAFEAKLGGISLYEATQADFEQMEMVKSVIKGLKKQLTKI